MKKTPMLFSTPMVQAILEDRKTMTRRIVKHPYILAVLNDGKTLKSYIESLDFCPYGQVGDHIWVKEMHYCFGRWKQNGKTKSGKDKWKFYPLGNEIKYFDNPPEIIRKNSFRFPAWYKRNSLFMPYTACRLVLEITGKTIERLQDISEQDCLDEGIHKFFAPLFSEYRYEDYVDRASVWRSPVSSFSSLWVSVNGAESWKDNPFVWVIKFKKILSDAEFENKITEMQINQTI